MAGPAVEQALREMLARKAGAEGASTVEGVLLDPRSPVAALKALKDESKAAAGAGETEAARAAATAVYYAAIAGALVFHDHKITTHTYAQLHEGLSTLGAKPWAPDSLKDLFERACEICRGRLPAGETMTD